MRWLCGAKCGAPAPVCRDLRVGVPAQGGQGIRVCCAVWDGPANDCWQGRLAGGLGGPHSRARAHACLCGLGVLGRRGGPPARTLSGRRSVLCEQESCAAACPFSCSNGTTKGRAISEAAHCMPLTVWPLQPGAAARCSPHRPQLHTAMEGKAMCACSSSVRCSKVRSCTLLRRANTHH